MAAGDPFGVNGKAPNRNQGNAWLDNSQRRDRATFGGVAGGTQPDGSFQLSSAQQAAQQYQRQGQEHANRGAFQLNYGQANQSFDQANADRANAGQARGQQQQALGLMQSAAQGNQPSQAELLGRSMIGQSLRSQLAGAASARGGAEAQMAARRQAQQGAASFQQQGMNQLSALRANEMADARNAYMAGASGIRGQDYQGAAQAAGMAGQQAQMAQAQGGLEMQQRQLNQQGQQFYDQLGWNTQNSQADRNLEEDKLAAQNWQAQTQTNQHTTDRNTGIISSALGAAGSVLGSIFSDEDAKVPLLLSVGGGSKGPAPASFDAVNGGGMNVLGSLKAHSDFGTRFARNPGAAPSDERTKVRPGEKGVAGAPKGYAASRMGKPGAMFKPSMGGWGNTAEVDEQRGEAPGTEDDRRSTPKEKGGPNWLAALGSGLSGFGHMYSDEGAKRAAFEEGARYATKQITGEDMAPWSKEDPNVGEDADPPALEVPPAPPGPSPLPPPPPAKGADRKPSVSRTPASAPARKRNPLTELQRDANRRGAGFAYAYKDEFRPPEQAPGEMNFGPSANELERNPLTATAVKRDPNGMRMVDVNKLVKNNTAGIASLQEQIDEMQGGLRYG